MLNIKTKPRLSNKINQTIYSKIFPQQFSKADQRKLKIIEGALQTYANLGVEYVSYEDISRNAKTSRPLIQHYFPEKSELLKLTMLFIRGHFQELAVGFILEKENPLDQFKSYIRSTYHWVIHYPHHVRAWFLYFYLCTSNSSLKSQHSQLTEMGKERIVALLERGVLEGYFSSGNLESKAKCIQKIITGAINELVTEPLPKDLNKHCEETIQFCLKIIT